MTTRTHSTKPPFAALREALQRCLEDVRERHRDHASHSGEDDAGQLHAGQADLLAAAASEEFGVDAELLVESIIRGLSGDVAEVRTAADTARRMHTTRRWLEYCARVYRDDCWTSDDPERRQLLARGLRTNLMGVFARASELEVDSIVDAYVRKTAENKPALPSVEVVAGRVADLCGFATEAAFRGRARKLRAKLSRWTR